MSERVRKYKSYSDAFEMVEDMLVVAQQAVEAGGSPELIRELDKKILELSEGSALLWAAMIAIRENRSALPMPSTDQVAEIAALTGEVEAALRSSETVSNVLDLTGRALQLAGQLA